MSKRLLDLTKLKVLPLEQRASELRYPDILVNPSSAPAPTGEQQAAAISECVGKIRNARKAGASVMLTYGAHLIKNGGAAIVNELIRNGWVTHVATNGAGVIHDWEFAFLGRSSESVRNNVATGTFGTWKETGLCIHLALMAGALEKEGFGESIGRFVEEDGATLRSIESLENCLRIDPSNPLTPAKADLLQALRLHQVEAGRHEYKHPWKASCVVAEAFRRGIPMTVHPGIGYDIIANNPIFNGAVIGRAATVDFKLFAGSVDQLDGGVVLSVGSAIMGPQVFEKTMSCVNNLRLQANRPIVKEHSIYVVDIQDGGNWDWSKGEPPKDNPAYYLRFCKSYSRMGGTMRYVQSDNVSFLHQLLHRLAAD